MNRARSDLCGGRPVMDVPTANPAVVLLPQDDARLKRPSPKSLCPSGCADDDVRSSNKR